MNANTSIGSHPADADNMRIRAISALWLPLAVSFELMMLEGPVIQHTIAKLTHPSLNLAAFGLTMSISLIIESPVIMLLATAIALVKDDASYRALRRFMIYVATACTVVTAIVAYTPLFSIIATRVMGQPPDIVAAAAPALRIMLLWSAAIAWRRFYQGILIRHGRTRLVSFGTAIRLLSAVSTSQILGRMGILSGSQVGACALMVAVITEAVATSWFAFPIAHKHVPVRRQDQGRGLTQRQILSFHAPLAATTLLTLLAQPMTATALAHLAAREQTLAAWPVVFMVLLVIRGWGLAIQEISVAYAAKPEARSALIRFTWIVGVVSTLVTMLIVVTPLLNYYLAQIVPVPRELRPFIRIGVSVGAVLPLITALGSWARGTLVAAGATSVVYKGMGINLAAHATLLVLGVLLQSGGMLVAAVAFTLAAAIELVYLYFEVARVTGRAIVKLPVASYTDAVG